MKNRLKNMPKNGEKEYLYFRLTSASAAKSSNSEINPTKRFTFTNWPATMPATRAIVNRRKGIF